MNFDYSKIKGNYSLLWTTFKKALLESINETNKLDFEKAWKSRTERTRFYFAFLFPKIAIKMNLEFKEEMFFRVDGTFFITAGQTSRVPIIILESENNPYSSHDEVNKLCLINAPLKVLMICTEWNDTSKKLLTEKYWNYIIEDFAEEGVLTGYFAIIIAEWNENLKIYTYVYDDKGVKIDIEDTLLIEV